MSNLVSGTCVVCSRKQEFSKDGLYLVSKGWHTAEFSDRSNAASNFGVSLRLKYPAENPNLCPDCVGKVLQKYLDRAERFGEP